MTAPVCFWRPDAVNGCLSNWSAHPVKEDGKLFRTTEHYYMYHKALAFGDEASALLVLQCRSPRDAKRIGRGVAGFDEKRWVVEREEVMLRALRLKVAQNPGVAEHLQSTGDRRIAETNPFDEVWGTGRRGEGQNLLGKLWEVVRSGVEHPTPNAVAP